MDKNKIIKSAIVLCKALMLLLILLFLVFIFMLVHSSIQPQAYNHIILADVFKPGWGSGNIIICRDCTPTKEFFLSQISITMKFWLAIRMTFFFTISYLIFFRLLIIFRSVRTESTFYDRNIKQFRILAKYGILAFLMSSFNFNMSDLNTDWHFTLAFGPLIFSISCLVLSEIFREGKSLLLDKESII